MPRELIAVICRHGETAVNAENRFRSFTDPPLNDAGIADAERLAEFISRRYKLYKLTSSPMLRAVQTADIIGEKLGLKTKQDRGLFPWHLGTILTGKDKDEYDSVLQFFIDNPKTPIPDGESLDDFEERVEEYFNDALKATYNEAPTGTLEGGYAEEGPYHCRECVHKPAPERPYCLHPHIVNSAQMKERVVKIGGKRMAKIDLEKGCCEYVKPHEDADTKIQAFVTHTSVIVSLENLCHGNRDGRPEAGEEAVGPGGLAEIYSTDDGYDIVPVLEDQPAKFGE